MIEKKKFEQLCRKYFNFLEKDYGFRLVRSEKYDWGYEIKYKSSNVGVILTFEFRDFYLFVKVCKMVRGEFAPMPGEIGPNTLILGLSGTVLRWRKRQNSLSSIRQY